MQIKCEIYSRVSGYYRPVNQWNRGKQEEHRERVSVNFDKEELYVRSTTKIGQYV